MRCVAKHLCYNQSFKTNKYLFELIWKIIFTSYFSEFIHVAIKFRFWKALQKKCFQSDIILRLYVKMLPIIFWKRLTNFKIFISLSEKFCCQNLITNIIKVINITGHSSKSNKLRNINTIGCRTRNITIYKWIDHNIKIKIISFILNFCLDKTVRYR